MASWERRSPAQWRTVAERALREQVVDVVGPSSPFWRARLSALGRTPEQLADDAALRALPAVGERDACPDGDPAGAAALVLQAPDAERAWALHAGGPALRRAVARRLLAPGSYRAQLDADLRATVFDPAGLAVRYPVASTRSDLDVLARAGARLWRLLGLAREDVLVARLPAGPARRALELAALASGSPAAFADDAADPGEDGAAAAVPAGPGLAELVRLLPLTVLALPAAQAGPALSALDADALAGLRLLLLVGAPTPAELADAQEALLDAGVRADVLPLHSASGHRLLWAPCREGGADAGLHLLPDLELVHLVDPETGADAGAASSVAPGEVVVTQLGLRGSALLRWRTGDLAEAVQDGPCPACGRALPRVRGLVREALVPKLRGRAVDLRAVTAALVGRPDLRDWRVEVDRGERLLVHVVPARGTEPASTCVAVARAVHASAGSLPDQVVLAADGLPDGAPVTRRVVRSRAGRAGGVPAR